MKKNIPTILVLITTFVCVFAFVTTNAHTQRGCCSSHGGVDCDAGTVGKEKRVICMDGWRKSKCLWKVECGEGSVDKNGTSKTTYDEKNIEDIRLKQYQYGQRMENHFYNEGYNISVDFSEYELWVDTSRLKNDNPKDVAYRLYNSAKSDSKYIEVLKRLRFVSVNYLYGKDIMNDAYELNLDDY